MRAPTHFLISEAGTALEGAPVLGLCLRHLLHQAVHISLSLHHVWHVIILMIVIIMTTMITMITMIMIIMMIIIIMLCGSG